MSVSNNQFCTCRTAGDLPQSEQDAPRRRKGAVLKSARWQPGDSITIRFLGGAPELQERVKNVAKEWLQVANLNFEFVNGGETDIRIAFMPGQGSWSYLGTTCRMIPEPQPTMNYGWLTPDSDDAELRRVVLHEFGHAIGMIHEHLSPLHPIAWNVDAVIKDLSGPPNNWSEDTIQTNMFQIYEPDAVIATPLDPESIMMYPIPKAWTTDGFSVGLNSELSTEDKAIVRSVYP